MIQITAQQVGLVVAELTRTAQHQAGRVLQDKEVTEAEMADSLHLQIPLVLVVGLVQVLLHLQTVQRVEMAETDNPTFFAQVLRKLVQAVGVEEFIRQEQVEQVERAVVETVAVTQNLLLIRWPSPEE
jgi:hypothetical protein